MIVLQEWAIQTFLLGGQNVHHVGSDDEEGGGKFIAKKPELEKCQFK